MTRGQDDDGDDGGRGRRMGADTHVWNGDREGMGERVLGRRLSSRAERGGGRFPVGKLCGSEVVWELRIEGSHVNGEVGGEERCWLRGSWGLGEG